MVNHVFENHEFLTTYFNIKTKKAKEAVGVQTLTVCGLTFMLKTQYLTYDNEKLEKRHKAVDLNITWISQGKQCRIRFIEKVTGSLNHLAALVLPCPALILFFYDVR